MKIIILGNGGAINDGLPYNSFLIDDTTLIETPPDIMISLKRENIDIKKIKEIYISHLHGDHSFGLPFLALNIFHEAYTNKSVKKIRVYSPKDGKGYFIDLAKKALSEEHPCIKWINDNMQFIKVDENIIIELSKYNATLYKMDHFEETYGFILEKNEQYILSYIADTKWCSNVEKIILKYPKYIIIDLNGEPDDPVYIHLSEKEIIEKVLNKKSINTTFLGTHLKYQKEISINKCIKYVYPGMVIEI